jgi:hypothetical protein
VFFSPPDCAFSIFSLVYVKQIQLPDQSCGIIPEDRINDHAENLIAEWRLLDTRRQLQARELDAMRGAWLAGKSENSFTLLRSTAPGYNVHPPTPDLKRNDGMKSTRTLIAAVLLLAGMAWADSLGTTRSKTVSCPEGNLSGVCYAVTISCPEISDFTGYVKVTYPRGFPFGTIIFTTGGNGTDLYEGNFTYGTKVLNTVLQGGFTVAQVSWGHPFADQPFGWQTGPGGIRAVACRYATLAQWVYTNIHQGNSEAPYCATGNSAGSQQIGLALTHYGLGSIFAMVEPTSGPPFSRQDWACDCSHASAVNSCGVLQGYCVGLPNAEDFVDPAYSAPICSEEVETRSTTYDSIFLRDSVMAPDAQLSYPSTFVKFLFGGRDPSTAPNQGQTWESAITSSKAEACVADADHEIPNSLDGAEQIASDLLTYCQIQHRHRGGRTQAAPIE